MSSKWSDVSRRHRLHLPNSWTAAASGCGWRHGTPPCSSPACRDRPPDLRAAVVVARAAGSRDRRLDAARVRVALRDRRTQRAGARRGSKVNRAATSGCSCACSGGSETLFDSMPPEWASSTSAPLAGPRQRRDQARARDRAGHARSGVGAAVRRDDPPGRQEHREPRRAARALPQGTASSRSLIVLAGLAGGFVVTRSTLRPIQHLIDVVRGIIATGRTDTRVPVRRAARRDRRAQQRCST